MTTERSPFYSLIRSPVRFRLFLLKKLPAAYFSGVRVQEINEEGSVVTIPFKWFTQNPFRSIYFACLSMAAEMSSGVLSMAAIWNRKPAVSMLVVSMKASFHKKATGLIAFHCRDGRAISEAVERAIETGEGQSVETVSRGYNEEGDLVAEFLITWSFKKRGH